jgi:chromosome segregation ATPase
MPSCFPVFFNNKSKSKKRGRTLSNLSNDQIPSSSASTISNDTYTPNNLSNASVNTAASVPGTTTHTNTKEVITIREYAPLKSEPQMSLQINDREAMDRLNAELKLTQSELKAAQLKLKISTEKNEQLLRQQDKTKKALNKKQLELEEAEKRIADLIKKDKDLEEINRQVKEQLNDSKMEPEVEALITGLAYSLKEAYEEIENYKGIERDLLTMANETGEEIRRLQIKQKDSNLLATECGQELCEAKGELEQACQYINQLKTELNNSEQIIVGLVNELKAANSDYENLAKENNDLNTFANETGEEIVHLRAVNKDQNSLINEVGQEFLDAKNEIAKLQSENKALCLLLNGLGEECIKSRDRVHDLEDTENDLLLLANESGEEIQKLRQKIRDQVSCINEAGEELVSTKRELSNSENINKQYCVIIEGLANMLNETNAKMDKYVGENKDLMELANESGEEIVFLRSKIRDSNNLINELGNELLETKEKSAHYEKCANLFISLIEVLSKEYTVTEKDKEYLENERDDLINMANETGDEIIAVRNKLRDNRVLINECATELIEAKAKNEQLKQQNEIQDKLIEGLTQMLNETNVELEKTRAREQDMEILANEAGQEICELRDYKKDTKVFLNEAGNEICALKQQLEQVKQFIGNYEAQAQVVC